MAIGKQSRIMTFGAWSKKQKEEEALKSSVTQAQNTGSTEKISFGEWSRANSGLTEEELRKRDEEDERKRKLHLTQKKAGVEEKRDAVEETTQKIEKQYEMLSLAQKLNKDLEQKSDSSSITFSNERDELLAEKRVASYNRLHEDEKPIETTQEIYDKWGKYYYESDYGEYSAKGAAIVNPSFDDAQGWITIGGRSYGGDKVGNKVTFSLDNKDSLIAASANGTGYKDWKLSYGYMTDFEVGIYNYLLAKNGEDAAQEFLDDIENTLAARQGGQIAEGIKNEKNGFIKALEYGAASFSSGLGSFGTGVKQLFSEEELPVTAMEVANELLVSDLTGFKKELYQAGNTVGNMVPSVAVGFVNPLAGKILQSSSAAGSSYRQALIEGRSKEEAKAFGVMTGSLEFITQSLLGGAAGLTGDLPKKALTKISAIDNVLLRVVAKYGINLASEITEEEVQLWLEPLARSIAFGEDYDTPELEEMVETAIVTGLSTGILNSTTDVLTGNLTKVDGLSKYEAQVINAEVNKRIEAKEADGTKLTNKQKTEIREAVMEDMDNGQLDIDTIESTLGGKTYEEYKSLTEKVNTLTEQKKGIENEIASLVKTPEAQFTVEQRERLTSLREEAKGIKDSIKSLDTKGVKSRLSDEVFSIAKNTRLGETYAERTRRGQAFEADLSHYKGAQRAAVERAIKSGVLNNTYRAHQLVDTLSRLEADKGITFDYSDSKRLKEAGFTFEGYVTNGFADKNKGAVTINVQASKAWQSVVGHEITHVLETNPEAYKALRESLYAYAESKGELASRRAKTAKMYDGKNADIEAELTADLVGDYLFGSKDFIDKLTGNRTLFQKLWDEVKYLCKVATGKELTEIEKVEREFARAWKEYGQTEQTADTATPDIQLSVSGKDDFDNSLAGVDKNDDLSYNKNDLYTASDDFYREVGAGDRDTFARSLANKTADLAENETRIIEIYGGRVYYFEATGYMQGQMLYSAKAGDVAEYKKRKEYIYAKGGNKRLFDRWSSILSSDGGREGGDIRGDAHRRAETYANGVYGNSRESNGTGTQKRNGQNFENDSKEVESLVAELRKSYGLTENHPTNDIAPIKEVSSTDDAFFDGENSDTQYSLSPTLDSDLDKVLNGTFDAKNGEVYLGETSNFMTNVIGAKSLKITMPASKVYSALVTLEEYEKNPLYTKQDHYHGIGKEDFIEILEKSENPVAAFAAPPDEDGNSRHNRIVLVTDKIINDVENGGEGYAVVVEEVDTKGRLEGKQIRVNKAITVYPRAQIEVDINQAIADGRILDIKTKKDQLSAGRRGSNPQATIRQTDLTNNIARFWANVKWEKSKNKIFSAEAPGGMTDMQAKLMQAGLIDADGNVIGLPNFEEATDETRHQSDVDRFSRSLSFEGEEFAPVGDYSTPLNAVALEQDIAPVAPAADTNVDPVEVEKISKAIDSHYNRYEEISELIDRGVATSYIVDRVKSIYGGFSHDAIVEAVNLTKEKRFMESLDSTSMTMAQRAEAIRTHSLKEQTLERMYELGKSGGEFDYSAASSVLSQEEAYEAYNMGEIARMAARGTSKVIGSIENPEEIAEILSNVEAPMPENTTASPVENTPVAEGADTPNRGKFVKESTLGQVLTEEPETPKKKTNIFAKAVANFVDKGAAVENLSLKTKNRVLQDKYKAMGRSEAKAQYFMEHGKKGVKSLDAIRKEVDKTGREKDFFNYMWHKHNVERMSLESRERPNLERLTAEMSRLKLLHLEENQLYAIANEKSTDPKREELIKTVRDYLASKAVQNKPVFGYDVTAEMSQEAVREYETEHPEYVGFAQDVYNYMNYLRQMMVDEGIITQETADLWANMYPHYVPIRRAGFENEIMKRFGDPKKTVVNPPLKKATGGDQKILPLWDAMAMRTSQTFKAIDKNRFGAELKNTLGSATESAEALNIDDALDTVDVQNGLIQKGELGANPKYTIFENGKRTTFEITEELYDALKPTSEAMSHTFKVLNTASNLHRGVLTEYSIPFMASNFLKDTQDVLMNSQHPARTYFNYKAAIGELKNHGKYYTEYMENGGGDITYFDKQTKTFNKEKSKLRKFIGFPIDKISDVNNFIEKIPRLAEYIASRKKGASVDAAMLDAARVTTDFSAGGDVTKFLNRNGFTFLNASVQGAAQVVRNVREAKMNGLKGWLGLATKCAIYGLPAALLNGLFWDDDEEYEELSDYVKENYYIVFKYGDGKFVRLPKGRTAAVIQNLFEQVSNTLTGDDEADFGRFFTLFMENLAPNNPLDNNIFAPIAQAIGNKTWYGEDLVPTRLQDVPAAEQYDESTDAISKWLGEKTNISPYKINYLLNQYSGGVGDMFLPILTPEAERGDDSLVGNMIAPLKDKFTTDSVMNNQNVSDFYDTVDALTRNANSSYATDEDILMSKYINSVNAELGDLYKQKREIQNGTLTDAEKYAAVRRLQEQINELVKESLATYESVNVDNGYATVGDRHYKMNKDGEWEKITDKQLEKQNSVTSGLGISASEYWGNKEEYDYAYEYPEKYAVAKSVGGYSAYKTYSSELYDIKSDKDRNGKSINGSRKEKVIDYINNLDADYYAKIILYKSEYPSDNSYDVEIIEHLNSRQDLTYEERVTILTQLGFRVENGYIYAN